jgi:hypothetical protein
MAAACEINIDKALGEALWDFYGLINGQTNLMNHLGI